MKFEKALAKVKPGQYFKQIDADWSEHSVQFGMDEEGNLFWTAGKTSGGRLRVEDHYRDNFDYEIYGAWGDSEPVGVKLTSGPVFAISHPAAPVAPVTETPTIRPEQVAALQQGAPETLQRHFIADISNAVDLALEAGIYEGQVVDNVQTLANQVIRSVMTVVECSDTAPGWHVIKDAGEVYLKAVSVSPGITAMFDKINS